MCPLPICRRNHVRSVTSLQSGWLIFDSVHISPMKTMCRDLFEIFKFVIFIWRCVHMLQRLKFLTWGFITTVSYLYSSLKSPCFLNAIQHTKNLIYQQRSFTSKYVYKTFSERKFSLCVASKVSTKEPIVLTWPRDQEVDWHLASFISMQWRNWNWIWLSIS